MRGGLVLLVCLLIVGAWWLRHEAIESRPHPSTAARDAPLPTPTASTLVMPIPRIASAAADAPSLLAPNRLELKSDKLRERLDENIASRLYAEAARCYKGGLRRDQRIDLTYHLHVADGEVAITQVHVEDSTLADANLERCVQDRVLAAHWRDDQLPDLDEDDDVYMRVDGFTQYLANAAADGARPVNQIN